MLAGNARTVVLTPCAASSNTIQTQVALFRVSLGLL